MWLVPVRQLKPGHVLAHPVVDHNGLTLLNRGVTLTQPYVRALQEKHYRYVYIGDANLPIEVPAEESLDPGVRTQAIRSVRKAFEAVERFVGHPRIATIQDMIEFCRSKEMLRVTNNAGPLAVLEGTAKAIFDDIASRRIVSGTPAVVPDAIRDYNRHVEAAICAMLLAHRARLRDEQVIQVGHGALLHGIGDVFTRDLRDVPNRKHHAAVLSYELVKHCSEHGVLLGYTALEQFERPDGTGFPRGVFASNTIKRDRSQKPPIATLNGEIMAIARAVSEMLQGTADYFPLPCSDILNLMDAEAGIAFNQELVELLHKVLPPYPCGTEVRLRGGNRDGAMALVEEVHAQDIERPTLVLYAGSDGQRVDPYELYLRAHPDYTLERVILGTKSRPAEGEMWV